MGKEEKKILKRKKMKEYRKGKLKAEKIKQISEKEKLIKLIFTLTSLKIFIIVILQGQWN